MPGHRYVIAERIGLRIRDLRKAKGLSTTELAKLTGFSQQQISQVELGKINTPVGTLERIADGLGMTLRDLVGEHDATVASTASARQSLRHKLHAAIDDLLEVTPDADDKSLKYNDFSQEDLELVEMAS